jgi:hypothetical protein
MVIELNEQEQLALEQVLDEAIREMGPEVRRTSQRDYKEHLKAQKHLLEDVYQRLCHANVPVS